MSARLTLWIGTQATRGAAGIYRSTLDLDSGALAPVVHAAGLADASFLVTTADRRRLYAIGDGCVAAYIITTDERLEARGRRPCGGRDPAHVALDPSERIVLVSNYGDGSLGSFRVRPDGGLLGPISLHHHVGSGPDPSRQAHAHVHSAWPFPDGRHVAVCDLGSDAVVIYALAPDSAALALCGRVAVHPGAGPRHLAWSRDGTRAFVIGELDQTISVFRVDCEAGALAPLEVVEIAARAAPGHFTAAHIAADPTCDLVFASTRDVGGTGRDFFTVLSARAGALSVLAQIPARVSVPRHFGLAPGGRWLIAAGLRSDDLQVFRIDTREGALVPHGSPTFCPAPACIDTGRTAHPAHVRP